APSLDGEPEARRPRPSVPLAAPVEVKASRDDRYRVREIVLFEETPKNQTCRKCHHTFRHQIEYCAPCQYETRVLLVKSVTRLQKDGHFMQVLSDRVELSHEGVGALSAATPIATLRRPALFVQVRDMLAMATRKNTGYAVA
ncbi:MAG: hypothetical protein ACYCW6_32685, partial [Candidatus Xenobia bacterium]